MNSQNTHKKRYSAKEKNPLLFPVKAILQFKNLVLEARQFQVLTMQITMCHIFSNGFLQYLQ